MNFIPEALFGGNESQVFFLYYIQCLKSSHLISKALTDDPEDFRDFKHYSSKDSPGLHCPQQLGLQTFVGGQGGSNGRGDKEGKIPPKI